MDRTTFSTLLAQTKGPRAAVTKHSNAPPIAVPTFSEFEPSTFKEYVGQNKAKDLVQIFRTAAEKENRTIPNILLSGSAGLGKTTLAKLTLSGKACIFIDGNAVNSTYQSLIGYVIIDEIHNVKPDVCDSLNILLDNRTVFIIGCTTNPGGIPKALRSRFRNITLIPYSPENLVEMGRNYLARRKTFKVKDELLYEIAIRSRSNPRRMVNQYLSFIIDVASVKGEKDISRETVFDAFNKIGVDDRGLLEIDHRYLASFPEDGRPVGLQYLSAVLQADEQTIKEDIEPYLMQLGLIDRTRQGRSKINV